jgi:hypothetical protein
MVCMHSITTVHKLSRWSYQCVSNVAVSVVHVSMYHVANVLLQCNLAQLAVLVT